MRCSNRIPRLIAGDYIGSDGELGSPGRPVHILDGRSCTGRAGYGPDGTIRVLGSAARYGEVRPAGRPFHGFGRGFAIKMCGVRMDGTGSPAGARPSRGRRVDSRSRSGWLQVHSCGLRPEGIGRVLGLREIFHQRPYAAFGVRCSVFGVRCSVFGVRLQVTSSAGVNTTCGVTDAGIYCHCWGLGSDRHDYTRWMSRFVAVTARRSALMRSTGPTEPLTCRGSPTSYGQLDTPDGPIRVRGGRRSAHSCGLHTDGTASCWGRNESTGRRTGTERALRRPWQSDSGTPAVCVPDGTAVCWGDNMDGQTDVPTGTRFSASREPASTTPAGFSPTALSPAGAATVTGSSRRRKVAFTALSVGIVHSCGLRPGRHGRLLGTASHVVPAPPLVEEPWGMRSRARWVDRPGRAGSARWHVRRDGGYRGDRSSAVNDPKDRTGSGSPAPAAEPTPARDSATELAPGCQDLAAATPAECSLP